MHKNNTLLEFSNGAVSDLTELKEAQPVRVELPIGDRFLVWEAVRTVANTIGLRDALDRVLRQQNPNV